MTKGASQRLHAKRRARERFGIELNKAMRRRIVADIQAGRAEHVSTTSNRAGVFRVELTPGLIARVVYDRKRKNIATVLPS